MVLTIFLETSFIILFAALGMVAVLLTIKFANFNLHKRYRPGLGNIFGLFVFLMVLNFFLSWGLYFLMSARSDQIMFNKEELQNRD